MPADGTYPFPLSDAEAEAILTAEAEATIFRAFGNPRSYVAHPRLEEARAVRMAGRDARVLAMKPGPVEWGVPEFTAQSHGTVWAYRGSVA